MPDYVVELVADALNTVCKSINGSRVHLLGVAYKRDVNDMRESPALDVVELLQKRGARVSYTDPYVPELRHGGRAMSSVDLGQAIAERPDCAVICTDHAAFDYDPLVSSGVLIVDTRNALKERTSATIFRL
jgi:UDP-N-acetyl-D-glucosamine dehydrogenase